MIQSFRKVFEEKIFGLGYSFSYQNEGFYILYARNHFLTVRLILSEQPNFLIHGSKNGIDIQAIGYFNLTQSLFDQEHDVYIFMLHNRYKHRIESLILTYDELMKRLSLRSSLSERQKSIRLVFWNMVDDSIYNATNISPEGEWYLFSQGVGGRLADRTYLDYTQYLNSWWRLEF